MTREERENHISDLCDQHGCKDKIRRIHFESYVDHQWEPHPPMAFLEWWKTAHPDEVGVIQAFNTKIYRDEWHEAKEFGAA